MRILIIDEVSTGTVYNPVNYSDFIYPNDVVDLLLITNRASSKDKSSCLAVIEIESPAKNGMLEIEAFKMHKQYQIDMVYTKQEDLILRAAYIRQTLGIEGMQPKDALVFRDKEIMKTRLLEKAISVPAFQRILSPCDVIVFVAKYSFPVIIKPTLGSASAGVRKITDQEDLESYLAHEFYNSVDDQGKHMEYSGDLIIEEFVVLTIKLGRRDVSCKWISNQRGIRKLLAICIYQHESWIHKRKSIWKSIYPNRG